MREIKFRAWSKNRGKMLSRVLAGNTGESDEYTCHNVWIEEEMRWVNFDKFCGDIMQFTGLTDKNGVEIYEGDIVSARLQTSYVYDRKTDCFEHNFKQVSASVMFLEGVAGFYLKRESEFYYIPEDCEVIGNIYENPELIEEPADE